MDAEKLAYYAKLAEDERLKDLIDSYTGIVGNCDMFADVPENLPHMLLKTAREIRQEFHEIAKVFPEYALLAGEPPVPSAPTRIQGMIVEEDDPFAAMRDEKPAEPTGPINGMIAEDDDAKLFEEKKEETWGALNGKDVPEGEFTPQAELPDFNLSAPVGVIDMPKEMQEPDEPPVPEEPPVPPAEEPGEPLVPPVEEPPVPEEIPVAEKPSAPEKTPPAETQEAASDNNAIVNDESTEAYFRHIERQKEEQKKLREQEKTQYIDGKLQRDAPTVTGKSEVEKDETGPRMMNYRGRMVPEDEYNRLIRIEMEAEDGQDDAEQSADPFAPDDPFAGVGTRAEQADAPSPAEAFRPDDPEQPEIPDELEQPEEPFHLDEMKRPAPDMPEQPEESFRPDEPEARREPPAEPFRPDEPEARREPPAEPFRPDEPEARREPPAEPFRPDEPEEPKSILFGDETAPDRNQPESAPSRNQSRAEEIGRLVHDESDPFAPMKNRDSSAEPSTPKDTAEKSRADMEIEEALQDNSCLKDMTEFTDIFHGNSSQKDNNETKEDTGSVFGNFSFKDLFGKLSR